MSEVRTRVRTESRAALPVAGRGPRRRRDRYPGSAVSQCSCGSTVLSEAAERAGKPAVAAGDGQVKELRRGSPHDDVFRRAQHSPLREQSSGGVPPADATAEASNATVQVSGSSAAISVGSRRCPEFVQPRSPPSPFRELPTVACSLLQRLECGYGCLSDLRRVADPASPRPHQVDNTTACTH